MLEARRSSGSSVRTVTSTSSRIRPLPASRLPRVYRAFGVVTGTRHPGLGAVDHRRVVALLKPKVIRARARSSMTRIRVVHSSVSVQWAWAVI